MRQHAAPERIAGTLCFVFAVLCAMQSFRAGAGAMAVFTALVYLCLALARWTKRGALRLALCLPPGLALLLAPDTAALVALAAAWCCVIVVWAAPRAMPDYDGARTLFWGQAAILTVMIAIILGDKGFGSGRTAWGTLGFAAAFAVLSAAGLRLQRAMAEPDARTAAVNLAVSAAPLGAAAGAAGLVVLLGIALRRVIAWLLVPLGALYALLVGALYSVWKPLVEYASEHVEMAEEAAEELPEAEDLMQTQAAESLMREFDVTAPEVPWLTLGLVLLAAALAWLLVRYLRRARAPEEEEKEYEQGSALREEGGRRARRGGRTAGARGNAQRIRRIYREYLRCVRGAGVSVRRETTSLDVLHGAGDGEADRTLRALYLPARYGGAPIGDEQVRAARAALAAVKESMR